MGTRGGGRTLVAGLSATGEIDEERLRLTEAHGEQKDSGDGADVEGH